MATFTDALTGTGAIGANYTTSGAWTRTASGTRQTNTGNTYFKASVTGITFDSSNIRSEATVAYDSNGAIGMGVAVRWAAGATVSCYGLMRFANEVYWVEINAGAETTIAVVSTPGTGVVTLRMEAEGTTLRSYVNNTLVDTRTDATYTTGPGGLIAYGGGAAPTNYATALTVADLAGNISLPVPDRYPRGARALLTR